MNKLHTYYIKFFAQRIKSLFFWCLIMLRKKKHISGVGCHFLLQGIFLTQGLNPALLPCRQTLQPLSHQGSPIFSFLAKVKKLS